MIRLSALPPSWRRISQLIWFQDPSPTYNLPGAAAGVRGVAALESLAGDDAAGGVEVIVARIVLVT
jgi:hypothetical protein